MDHALRLAARGLGQVWPNPAVGCVIVQGDRVVGRGWTQPGGRPHAEAVALAQAGEAARGATAYVTLEPCAHHGHTPPCAAALIAAGVARVVTALTDPDPRVAGRGHAMLRAAGIHVTEEVRADAAARLNRGFLLRVTEGRPMLTLKLAASIDGRIATASGESRWITGPLARHHTHLLRLTHDAVMVGAATARADRPALTVRGYGPVRQPLRVVTGTPPPDLPEGAEIVDLSALPRGADGIAPDDVLRLLADRGITRVLCEGGGRLAASLLRAGLVDELVSYHAGLGLGADGLAALGPLHLTHLADAPRFALTGTRALGPDVMTRWTRI